MTFRIVIATAVLGLTASGPQQVFRARADVVTVDVSVLRGNNPVTGLTADDFAVYDNGVRQRIIDVRTDTVPIDVSLVVDVSGSTADSLERFRRDVLEIATLLRPADRIRLLAFAGQVREVFPLQPGSTRPPVERLETLGLTSANDGVVMALLQQPQLDRRQLAVVFTDAQDTISTLDARVLGRVAAHSETVLHVIWARYRGSQSRVSHASPFETVGVPEDAEEALEEAAEATGGRARGTGFWSLSMVGAFRDAFEEMRASYVVTYAPEDVPPEGWHDIRVVVTRPDANRMTIRARRGYFGGQFFTTKPRP